MDILTFWSGIVIILIPQVISLVNHYMDKKNERAAQNAQKPLTDAQARDIASEALGEALTQLGNEYNRMLVTHKALEEELEKLRPLTVRVALQERDIEQKKKDKDDWKHYAETLKAQLEKEHLIPEPFRRMPSNGDSHKMKAIKAAAKEQIVETVITPTETILENVNASQKIPFDVRERIKAELEKPTEEVKPEDKDRA